MERPSSSQLLWTSLWAFIASNKSLGKCYIKHHMKWLLGSFVMDQYKNVGFVNSYQGMNISNNFRAVSNKQ